MLSHCRPLDQSSCRCRRSWCESREKSPFPNTGPPDVECQVGPQSTLMPDRAQSYEHPVKKLLLTGPPGCGKTTVLERVVEHLGDLRLAGFLTLELREHGQRVGFEAVGLGGLRVILAHVRFRSLVSVGRYAVEPDRLIPLIEEELDRTPGTVDAFLIDEIGKMECYCPQFMEEVCRLLE